MLLKKLFYLVPSRSRRADKSDKSDKLGYFSLSFKVLAACHFLNRSDKSDKCELQEGERFPRLSQYA